MATIGDALMNAIRLHQAGNLQGAEAIYRQILQADPMQPDALHFLGVIAYQVGKHDIAIDFMKKSIELTPLNEAYHSNLGLAYQAAGRLDEAVAANREALRIKPDSPQAYNNLGNTLADQGKLDEASVCYERAMRLLPDFPDPYNNLAVARQKQGKLKDAEQLCLKAIRLKPDYSEAHHNLATAILLQGRRDEAIEQFHTALRLKPNYAEAHSNLATALQPQGKLDEAEEHLREALRIQPKLPDANNNLGGILQSQGFLDEASACYRAALALQPDYSSAFSNILLNLNYDPKTTDEALFAEHRDWGNRYSRVERMGPAPDHDRNPNRRLRIGYASPDLSWHPVCHFLEPILANHNPEQVESFCYAEVSAPDVMTAQLKSLAHQWRSTHGLNDYQMADMIRADRIDILVDLAGHTAKSRLRVFTHKPAPVQVTWLGYPCTTGLLTMDYLLTDAIVDPPGEIAWFTEELIRLPNGFCCYQPPRGAIDVNPLPAKQAGHITFGSMHNVPRLNGQVLDLWCALLRAMPSARLVIFRNSLQGKSRESIHRQLLERGMDPARFDLLFSIKGLSSWLDMYNRFDISLDTFPWSGHTTTCESLWMGVPMVTLRGTRHAGRMVSSVLTQVGLTDWIAETPEQYVEIAMRMGQDVDKLAEMRASLRERVGNSPLCDGKNFTPTVEAVYREIWQRWCGS
ncbi:MAG TPA: tetratricopeptide repeat protein [Gemmataceae bacterium]|nr:tetratricopeptide repeat protein [Gemmataceae bacterium]